MISLFIYISSILIGAIIWNVRMEGRLNTQETLQGQKHDDLKELISSRFDDTHRRLEHIERILNGALHRSESYGN